ncbi:30S ribosomal protein S6 [candidate division WOR-1 bacterium RIFOXYA2_FULL_36_21]|uniref:Small ribosomal subunit protein bS6 n=1 Tax=candidate division WOR-1 bacterium RIFOXYB2_FULL_36_35 TaxID=1802578 RepID=A0A1F4S0R2_UNCSA|nr:MAG: 30S ribosomal protein S6 [candidate division WOR-1 bacterium RIFOXYA2_FULL_36_21]OGC14021.1 MAG: 30S ribosomal protein S6 [candidate division WOR-1 bacterium RIFOXYB2_FULL_36_35]OGC14956.1 MAG: 30S ribosomal protein S6 [candidate division WOR-1 bacterium RIFOXYA12_FULL_36_13]
MRDYEALVILKSSVGEDKLEAFISRAKKKIEGAGGEFVKSEKMGNRKLPFRMKKHKPSKDGIFILIKFKSDGDAVFALRDDFRVQEDIIRHMISRISEEQKILIEEPEIAVPEMANSEKTKEAVDGERQ